MREAAMKRKLMQQASLLVKTNDPTTTLVAVASLLDALGSLMSEWTGESVRVRMTAEGQPDVLYMVKHPSVPAVDALAQFIREIDGAHRLGAGVLAERIVEWLAAATEAKPCP